MNKETDKKDKTEIKHNSIRRFLNKKTAKKFRNLLALVLVIFILDYFYSTIEGMKNELKDIKKQLDTINNERLLEKKNRGIIELSKENIQPIDQRFSIIIAGVKKAGSGVNVSSRIINATSLLYKNVRFTFKLSSKELEFTLPELRPGRAVPMTFRFTDVPLNDIRWGTVTYKSADIIYSMN